MPLTAVASTTTLDLGPTINAAREAQTQWAQWTMRERLAVVRRLRHAIARRAETLAEAVPLSLPGGLQRNLADTLAAEVLPLADACRYLEREAASILAPRKVSRRGRPFFMRHVEATVERIPLGLVLILGPANYPLFLPGVQALQALVAGNAVLWKAAPAGAEAAKAVSHLLAAAGLPEHLVTILDTDAAAAQAAIAQGVEKVVLTGHVSTGRAVLHSLADTVTPSVMELSGCDAVFVLPGADLLRAARAIAFGLRLNGSATCMAPRRLFVASSIRPRFELLLREHLKDVPPVTLTPAIARELHRLIEDAEQQGASTLRTDDDGRGPVLITQATPGMRGMRTDIFAPVVSMMEFADTIQAVAAHRACRYALTASVFGPRRDAAALAAQLRVGTVLINDIVVATADPRLPFGGREQSGFGATRGAEGLLEMTAVRTIAIQNSSDGRAYDTTTDAHIPFFSAYIRAAHSGTRRERFNAMRALGNAARALPKQSRARSRKA